MIFESEYLLLNHLYPICFHVSHYFWCI